MLTNLAVAAASAVAGAYVAASLAYGETEPFTGRTYLAYHSHAETRRSAESAFANFKKNKASLILASSDPHAVRVSNILLRVLGAARRGLALLAAARPSRWSRQRRLADDDELDWMDRLDWEVIVVRDEDASPSCFSGAGKIIVPTGALYFKTQDGSSRRPKTDAEIAVTLTHEVGHVVARQTSRIILGWLYPLLDRPILRIFLLHCLRRNELEADHIGLLLLAAAGFDPHIAVQNYQRMQENMEPDPTLVQWLKYTHPSHKKRWQFLSQPKVMNEAMELYKRSS